MKKIQTGIRVTEELYQAIKEQAGRSGISFNAQANTLIQIGLDTVNLGIQKYAHERAQIPRDTDE